jgi:predicted transcriptional regulator
MIEFEQVISVSEKDCKADSEINGIKARIKDLKDELKEKEGVYSDSINIAYAKIRYAVHVLESRGITLERNNS